MVIYTREEDIVWHPLPDRGLEIALLVHADPGQTHGERVGLSRAFDLAAGFGAVPIDHLLSYDLMTRYPRQFGEMMAGAGSNHTWLSTTLCIYTGKGPKNIRPKRRRRDPLLEFGFVEETASGMDRIVYPGDSPGMFRVYETTLGGPSFQATADEIETFLYASVPREREGLFNVVQYPHYSLRREGGMVQVAVDWQNADVIPDGSIERRGTGVAVTSSALLPEFLANGFYERHIHFTNPTLGFFAPAESYGPAGRNNAMRDHNFWRISTRGEGVIMQRGL